MKKLITRYFTGVIPFIAFCACSFAQTSKLSFPASVPSSKEVAYLDEAAPPSAPARTAAGISSKAVRNFNKTHEKKGNANWFALPDGFVAQFREEGITTKVFYDSKGRWVADLYTYMEDKMPKPIRHLVKSSYYDFSIIIVNEVKTKDGKAYLVKIEDGSSIKTIRISDDEMTETEAFQKSR